KGTGAALPDLLAGRLDFFFMTQFEAVGAVKSGHVRALAVTAPQRMPQFPGVPTMAELGFQNFDAKVTYGFVLPATTPAPVVQRLHEAVLKAMATPAVQNALQNLGAVPAPGTPQEEAATIRSE